jgi:hypothetical protein
MWLDQRVLPELEPRLAQQGLLGPESEQEPEQVQVQVQESEQEQELQSPRRQTPVSQ